MTTYKKVHTSQYFKVTPTKIIKINDKEGEEEVITATTNHLYASFRMQAERGKTIDVDIFTAVYERVSARNENDIFEHLNTLT